MLYRYYYVNGKRVSEDQYIAANARNEYEKFALKKAKDYYKTHQFAWNQLCMSTSKEALPYAMIYHFESTPQGEACRKEWEAKVKKSEYFMYTIMGIVVTVFIIAAVSVFAG